jgi:hypothetical protein
VGYMDRSNWVWLSSPLILGMVTGGCGGNESGQSVGCGSYSPCGGDLVGTWDLVLACGYPAECADSPTPMTMGYSETMTFNADGTATVTTSVAATDFTGTYTAACQLALGYSNYTDADTAARCAEMNAASNDVIAMSCAMEGTACVCSGHRAAKPTATATGPYTASGSLLQVTYPEIGTWGLTYCVSGDTLKTGSTLMPQFSVLKKRATTEH